MQVLSNSNVPKSLGCSVPLVIAIRSVHLGDQRQVEAVSAQLAELVGGEVQYISSRLRRRLYSGPTRLALHLGLFGIRWLSHSAFAWIWSKLFRGSALPSRVPMIVCSTLIPAELPSAVLSQRFGAVNVHLSRPKRVARKHFAAVITPQGLAPESSEITLSQAPTVLTASQIQKDGEELVKLRDLTSQRIWTLLVGGSGGGYQWQLDDYADLSKLINHCFEQFGVRWLVSTSPRTGSEAERYLRSLINPQSLIEGTWYSEQPRRVVSAYMGAAERILVTEESISMLSEATLTQKPLYSLAPRQFETTVKTFEFAQKLERAAHLRRIPLSQSILSAQLANEPLWFVPYTGSWVHEFHEQLGQLCPQWLPLMDRLMESHRSAQADMQIHFLRSPYGSHSRNAERILPNLSSAGKE